MTAVADRPVKDSGARAEFYTGSVRDTEAGKGRYDLLPPEAIRRLARLYQKGAEKYAARNWEKGQTFSRIVSSLLRHVFNYLEGQQDEDHLAAAAWNAMALMTYEERGMDHLNDLPWYKDLRPVADIKAHNARLFEKIDAAEDFKEKSRLADMLISEDSDPADVTPAQAIKWEAEYHG